MKMMNNKMIAAALAPIQRKLAMMAARAAVKLVDDSKKRQILQVEILKDELRDGVEHPQNYGFTSHPLDGSDAVIISVAGSREQCVAIVVDDRRYRLSLEKGEVAMFDDQGNTIKILRDKIQINAVVECEIIAPTVRVTADDCIITANTQITGNVNIDGNITSTGTVKNNNVNIGSTHTHPHGDPAGTTSPPNP